MWPSPATGSKPTRILTYGSSTRAGSATPGQVVLCGPQAPGPGAPVATWAFVPQPGPAVFSPCGQKAWESRAQLRGQHPAQRELVLLQ